MNTLFRSRLGWVLAALCIVAAFAPLLNRGRLPVGAPASFDLPPWPAEMGGRALRPLPLYSRGAEFAAGFPGKIQAFTDGQCDCATPFSKARIQTGWRG